MAASDPILDTIRWLHREGVWLEIVTLLIPGFNDAADELRRLTAFLVGVSPDIPWHVTAFHPDYGMTDRGPTTPAMLRRGGRHRPRGRAALRLRGQPARARRRLRAHATADAAASGSSPGSGYLIQDYRLDTVGLAVRGAECRHSRALGPAIRGSAHSFALSSRTTAGAWPVL